MNGITSTVDLSDQYVRNGVEPLWTVMHTIVPKLPAPKAEPAVWRYQSLRPILAEAGAKVTAEEAERRVLMLKNPALPSPQTTDTLYAGLQLILPGETAPAHRHQAFALRFIIEGSGGFTAVTGEKMLMQRRDMILTPQWQWHDHGHEGSEPMIWLDGLDIPLYHFFPTHFAEPYHEPRYPSELCTDSLLRFPWDEMTTKLDASVDDWICCEYTTSTAAHISRTLGAHAARLQAGKSVSITRESCSFVYHIVEGSGETEIHLPDGKIESIEWTSNDTIAVPAWSKLVHQASSSSDVYFFLLSDRPMLESLGMYVVEGEVRT